jgi:hypothetical protein
MDDSPEPERIPTPPESIPAPPAPIPAPPIVPPVAPPVAPPMSPPVGATPPPGPVSQWVPPTEARASSTIAWVALAVAVLVLLTLLSLIFLGGRVSQILSSIGTSV